MTQRTTSLKHMILLIFIVTCPLVSPAHGSVCSGEIQGKIAWNYQNNTQWAKTNIDRLCRGAEDSDEPAKCFSQALHGGIEHGSGNRWGWQDGVKLCAGTMDAAATISCFRDRISRGLSKDEAIDACLWYQGADDSATTHTPVATSLAMTMPVITLPQAKDLPRTGTLIHRTRSDAKQNHINQVATVAASSSLQGVAALMQFQLSFRGDHKLRRLTVLTDDRFARFALNDQGGEDNFWAEASWMVFSAGTTDEIIAAAQGQVELEIEPGPPNHIFALRGFEFRRADGTDANIRSIGIWPIIEQNKVRVWLIDDMGPDFRGLDETLAASLTAGALVPFGGAIVGGLASTWDALSRFSAQGGPRPYQFTLQYAWVPQEVMGAEGAVSGTHADEPYGWSPEGAHILQGFQFSFENSDHHIGAIGVTLGGDDHHIQFRDNDGDDPLQWAVMYQLLK